MGPGHLVVMQGDVAGVESKAWTVVRRMSTNVYLIIHCVQAMNGVTLGLQDGILLILEVRKDPRKRHG